MQLALDQAAPLPAPYLTWPRFHDPSADCLADPFMYQFAAYQTKSSEDPRPHTRGRSKKQETTIEINSD